MTLISHRFKFVFLANPKCASTTLHHFLRPYADKDFTLTVYQRPLGTHATASQVKRYLEKRNYRWEDYFVFTTIRHPLKRIRSCYQYERDFSKNRDITDLFTPTPRNFRKYVMKNWFNKRFYDIVRFTSDKEGNCLVNQIIKVEEIDQHMPEILKKLGIESDWLSFERKNISTGKNDTDFDDDMILHVKAMRPTDCSYYPSI